MLYLFKILVLLINTDLEKTSIGIGRKYSQDPGFENGISSFKLFHIISGLSEKIQDGLSLADIENVVILILFLRFGILAIRYNLKTSFYITCIGLFAGYFWYRHLNDIILGYRAFLLKIPFFYKLGLEATQYRYLQRQITLTELRLQETVHWYNPGQVLYTAFLKGITKIDPETGFKYYIDPISMLISILPEPLKANVSPIYYKLYFNTIPKIFEVLSKFWQQFVGIATYVVITRLGKRYCPYLIRWHWTFLLILQLVEQILKSFVFRLSYFQINILIPEIKKSVDPSLIFQSTLLNGLILLIVFLHIGFIIFGLLHAICGQYFYIPFLVDNTEIHVGPRPVNSIYSGGYTSWQDPNERSSNEWFPKLWYGWFGRGTKNKLPIRKNLLKIMKKLLKSLQKFFQR